MKRTIRSIACRDIETRLRLLIDLRTKQCYTKISDKRRKRIRNQIRWQLKWLRYELPRMEGIINPCDPETWEIKHPTDREKQNASLAYAMMISMFRGKL